MFDKLGNYIRLVRGDNATIPLAVITVGANDTAVFSLYMTGSDADSAILTKTYSNATATYDTAGNLKLILVPDDTKDLLGNYQYCLKVKTVSGGVTSVNTIIPSSRFEIYN